MPNAASLASPFEGNGEEELLDLVSVKARRVKFSGYPSAYSFHRGDHAASLWNHFLRVQYFREALPI
jgi:hypothetical protein